MNPLYSKEIEAKYSWCDVFLWTHDWYDYIQANSYMCFRYMDGRYALEPFDSMLATFDGV